MNRLWNFIDEDGSFRAEEPQKVSRLYFPLGNEAGLLSAVTPDLHGDIKTGQNCFLTQPASEQDLHSSRVRRDFWISTPKGAWLANAGKASASSVEAGPLWHRLRRENKALGLSCEVLNFVPAAPDRVEVMVITVRNTGRAAITITPTAAVPLYARSADNLRDHRHVTSLLHRIHRHKHGVLVCPTMTFDERGHKINRVTYAALGFEASGAAPAGSFPTVDAYIGEGGDHDRPAAVLENLSPRPWSSVAGREAMGALRFKTRTLKPGQEASFVLLLGVADPGEKGDAAALISSWIRNYGSLAKTVRALAVTKDYWKKRLDAVRVHTGDPVFDGWARWVTLQPMLRKIFGCSFLPDFDYGRGGRGWRDLWQDCLALLLLKPEDARPLLLNNFGGIRLDGSNATIIGRAPGEFLADRNSITRVWMDHGLWPFLTTDLYIHQSGDFSILDEEIAYFRDPQMRRARVKDAAWTEAYGRRWKTESGKEYRGTVLEHMLVQHLCSFFNVGEHNLIRLEDADWNDGLDMAHGRGESVAFSAQYAGNLAALADLIERRGQDVEVLKELSLLLDRTSGKKVNYNAAAAKRARLEAYFDAVSPEVSGKRVKLSAKSLAADLRAKAAWLTDRVRKGEWVRSKSGLSWFNGYYDGQGRRVEGDHAKGPRMTLTGQVFPLMSGVATDEQCRQVWTSARRLLQDKARGGFRLNTDFKELQPALGRAFSFAYGDKENGAVFSHMDVMFANALYRRGMVEEGREVLHALFNMAVKTDESRIYPGLPEYFNGEGRGLYHYLTGSASWYVLTLLTVAFGVRGQRGDLLLDPRLTPEDYSKEGTASVDTSFAGRRITVRYRNPQRRPYRRCRVTAVSINGSPVPFEPLAEGGALLRRSLLKDARGESLLIEASLGA